MASLRRGDFIWLLPSFTIISYLSLPMLGYNAYTQEPAIHFVYSALNKCLAHSGQRQKSNGGGDGHGKKGILRQGPARWTEDRVGRWPWQSVRVRVFQVRRPVFSLESLQWEQPRGQHGWTLGFLWRGQQTVAAGQPRPLFTRCLWLLPCHVMPWVQLTFE